MRALRSQAFVHTKRGREAAAMAALNEAVEVATTSLGVTSDDALAARACSFEHFHALRARAPGPASDRACIGACPLGIWRACAHTRVLSNIERFYADALARNDRPREAASILRQVLADTRALDVEETTHVRIAMTLLANALQLGGHLDEAQSLVAQSEALHERLTGGVNDEGIGWQTGTA